MTYDFVRRRAADSLISSTKIRKGLTVRLLKSVILVSIFCTLISLPVISPSQAAPGPQADYGDAPDDTLNPGNVFAYPGVVARFPSLYDTNNARVAGRRGAHNMEPFEAWLSKTSNVLSTTTETDAKLVDADEDDAEPMLYIDKTTNDSFLVVRVVVAPTAPDVVRYINVLIDQNQDGEWRNDPNNPEWVGINHPVRVPPSEARNVIVGPIPLRSDFTIPVWTRISLTNDYVDHEDFDTYEWGDTFFEKNGWDGSAPSGGFSGGETEDHLFENSGDVPDTNLTAVWAGGAGAPPPCPLKETKLGKAIPKEEKGIIRGITYRWHANKFRADGNWHKFGIVIKNIGYRELYVTGVTITPVKLVDPRASVSHRVLTDFPKKIRKGDFPVTIEFEKRWDYPDWVNSEEARKNREWCPNKAVLLAWYKVEFEFDPPGDPYVDEIESLDEPSPPPCPVGCIGVPVDKFGLLAPYITLASTILVATAATVAAAIYAKHAKRRKKNQ